MTHRNDLIASGTDVVVADTDPVNYVGLLVLSASDLTYVDGRGFTTALTACPAGVTIAARVVQVTVCTGVVLGYVA